VSAARLRRDTVIGTVAAYKRAQGIEGIIQDFLFLDIVPLTWINSWARVLMALSASAIRSGSLLVSNSRSAAV
jgi:hypothetical protein